MKPTIGILGLGEVGKAIQKLAKGKFTILTKDLDHNNLVKKNIDTLHVCIPYSSRFISAVTSTIKELETTSLIIIDSTVKPGTTRSIGESTNVDIVHSPIMGVHPNLDKYQKSFKKVIGPMNKRSYTKAANHWKKLGASKFSKFDNPENSELAKLLSTTYYGWNIIYNKFVHNLTNKTKTNFDQVYTEFNKIYNEGYSKTLPHVTRPVLKYQAGKIGGHCVIPNAEILLESYGKGLIENLINFNTDIEE